MTYPLISHVDVRISSRAASIPFYDQVVPLLGPAGNHWFGFIEETGSTPKETRIAFNTPDRATVDAIHGKLHDIGARVIERDDTRVRAELLVMFFEDPDGNKLEIMAYREKQT
ncbi:MAG: hypothetical protein NVSMB64_03750 [Candidatus Velthaea sp.]